MRLIPPKISQRLAALHPDHKRIARGAVWVSLFVLLGKLAGATKEMAVAYRYGVSGVVDAYQLAFTVVTWMPGTLVSVIGMVVIPILVRLRQRDAADRALFLEEMHGTLLLLGGLFMLVSVFLGPLALTHLAANLMEETRQMAQQLIYGIAPVAMLTLAIRFFAARLQAEERQINTLLESVPAAAICGFVLFWPKGAVIAPLLWGVLLGYVVQTAWLAYLARRADGQSARPRWSWRSSHWPEFYQAVGVMTIGQFVMSLITPMDQYFAAQLGDSAIATLSYANRVIALLIGLGSVAVSRATLPVFSEIAALGDWARARSMALKWSGLMLAVGGGAAIVGWLTAPWVIGLLFQRGAFTAEDTVVVAAVFRWSLVQLPFYFAVLVLVQLMASRNRFGVMSVFAATNFLAKLGFNLLLVPRMGIEGIALATSLMYFYSLSCFLGLALWLGRKGPTT
jgi:peptidoglycan biosynthesis protein MviN/MurJ (putative lipid II flippase)